MNLVEVNDSSFESEVLEASNSMPVLVDFWAEWCQPCKLLAPTFAELAQEMSDKVKFVKMNVDDQDTPQNYKVRGIPALYLFVDGKLKAQTHGAKSKQDLQAFITDSLAEEA